MMINNEIEKRIFGSLPSVMYRYLCICGFSSDVDKDFLIFTSGLPFSAIIHQQVLENKTDITCFPVYFDLPMYRVLSYLGCDDSCELIQKFGNVYNESYFIRRLQDNLRLGRPVIAKNLTGDNSWNLIIEYLPEDNRVRIETETKTELISDWYKNIDTILLLQKPKVKKLFSSSLDWCQQFDSLYGIDQFYTGYQAHRHVLKSLHTLDENKWRLAVLAYMSDLYLYRSFCTQFLADYSQGMFQNNNRITHAISILKKLCEQIYDVLQRIKTGCKINDIIPLIEILAHDDHQVFCVLNGE